MDDHKLEWVDSVELNRIRWQRGRVL
jgi:hypothetical protein